mgnify:CR=1 FL=1
MSITQRYWLVWAPGLILAGFFGGGLGFATLFLPSYMAYYGHRKEWGIGKFALAATLIMLVLFFIATARH